MYQNIYEYTIAEVHKKQTSLPSTYDELPIIIIRPALRFYRLSSGKKLDSPLLYHFPFILKRLNLVSFKITKAYNDFISSKPKSYL